MCSSCSYKLIDMKKQKMKSDAQKGKECRHEKTIKLAKKCRPITSCLTEVCNNICQPEPTESTPTVSTSYSEFDSENTKTVVKCEPEYIEQE